MPFLLEFPGSLTQEQIDAMRDTFIEEGMFNEFKNIFKKVRTFSTAPVTHKNALDWIEKQKEERGIKQLAKAKSYKFGDEKKKQAPEKKPEPKKVESKPKVDSQPKAQQDVGPVAKTQAPMPSSIMDKARAMGLSYYGFGRFGKNHQVTHLERNGQLVTKKLAESLEVNKRFDKFLKEEHGAGEEGTPELTNNYRKITPGEKDRSYYFAKKKKIEEWASKPETIQKFTEKYGAQGPQKLQETTDKLINSFSKERQTIRSKTLKEFKNQQ